MSRTARAFSLAALFLCIAVAGAHAQSTVTGSTVAQPTITGSGVTQTTGTGSSGTGLQNPLKDSDLTSLLTDVLNFVITIGGIVIVLMLIYCGFLFVKAQGNAEALQEARNMLLWTVVGALIILGATAIQSGVQATVQSLSS